MSKCVCGHRESDHPMGGACSGSGHYCLQRCTKFTPPLAHGPDHAHPDAWVHSLDAQVWADKFAETLALKPYIARDRDTMVGWFANAIMAGYDEAQRRLASSPSGEREMDDERAEEVVRENIPERVGDWDDLSQLERDTSIAFVKAGYRASRAPQPSVPSGEACNHDEALELAYIKRAESNLARCYIELRAAPPQDRVSEADVRRVYEAVRDWADPDLQGLAAWDDVSPQAKGALTDALLNLEKKNG